MLVPARVDQGSGYRYYDTAQLDEARLVVMMRQLQLPLAAVRELLACDPADAATRIAEHWRDTEAAHDARRDLAGYLVSRLRGKRSVMYEVATREMPERSLLCLKRNVDEQGQWAFGKEFIAILRELTLRTEPAHREAFVVLPVSPAEQTVHWQLALESLQAWAQEQGIEDERLTLKPEDLGIRTTYLATAAVTATSVPDDYCDLAVPFAAER